VYKNTKTQIYTDYIRLHNIFGLDKVPKKIVSLLLELRKMKKSEVKQYLTGGNVYRYN